MIFFLSRLSRIFFLRLANPGTLRGRFQRCDGRCGHEKTYLVVRGSKQTEPRWGRHAKRAIRTRRRRTKERAPRERKKEVKERKQSEGQEASKKKKRCSFFFFFFLSFFLFSFLPLFRLRCPPSSPPQRSGMPAPVSFSLFLIFRISLLEQVYIPFFLFRIGTTKCIFFFQLSFARAPRRPPSSVRARRRASGSPRSRRRSRTASRRGGSDLLDFFCRVFFSLLEKKKKVFFCFGP